MQEVPISDSEDEAVDDLIEGETNFQYFTNATEIRTPTRTEMPGDDLFDTQPSTASSPGMFIDEMKYISRHDNNFYVTMGEQDSIHNDILEKEVLICHHQQKHQQPETPTSNEGIVCQKLQSISFLVSFLVDARGGNLHSRRQGGVRVIVPSKSVCMPTRFTCRLIRKDKLPTPPPLMEGEALACRPLETVPAGYKFDGLIVIEAPHFASLRRREREIVILRSDDGTTWREHSNVIDDVVSIDSTFDDNESTEDVGKRRLVRITTRDLPNYFVAVSRLHQESAGVGLGGGVISSTIIKMVQVVFPDGALTKNIKVSLQVLPVPSDVVTKYFGNRMAMSPIVTLEPRRRRFHKAITLTLPSPRSLATGVPVPQTLKLFCSVAGGTSASQWEDITDSTQLLNTNGCISFTSTISARFWLLDCQSSLDSGRIASQLYANELCLVPFFARFVAFARRQQEGNGAEAKLRMFVLTDDKQEKLLETKDRFVLVAASRDVELLDGQSLNVTISGNLQPTSKNHEITRLVFRPLRENRFSTQVRLKDLSRPAQATVRLLGEIKGLRPEAGPIASGLLQLTVNLPPYVPACEEAKIQDDLDFREKYEPMKKRRASEQASPADVWLAEIADAINEDYKRLGQQLELDPYELERMEAQAIDVSEKALLVLQMWIRTLEEGATADRLEEALASIGRSDVLTSDSVSFDMMDMPRAVDTAARRVLRDSQGFGALNTELGISSQGSSIHLRNSVDIDASYDEIDIIKDSESILGDSSDLDENNEDKKRDKDVDKFVNYESECRAQENLVSRNKTVGGCLSRSQSSESQTPENRPIALADVDTYGADTHSLQDEEMEADKISDSVIFNDVKNSVEPVIVDILATLKESLIALPDINKSEVSEPVCTPFEGFVISEKTVTSDELRVYPDDNYYGQIRQESGVPVYTEINSSNYVEIPELVRAQFDRMMSKKNDQSAELSNYKLSEQLLDDKLSEELLGKLKEEFPVTLQNELPDILLAELKVEDSAKCAGNVLEDFINSDLTNINIKIFDDDAKNDAVNKDYDFEYEDVPIVEPELVVDEANIVSNYIIRTRTEPEMSLDETSRRTDDDDLHDYENWRHRDYDSRHSGEDTTAKHDYINVSNINVAKDATFIKNKENEEDFERENKENLVQDFIQHSNFHSAIQESCHSMLITPSICLIGASPMVLSPETSDTEITLEVVTYNHNKSVPHIHQTQSELSNEINIEIVEDNAKNELYNENEFILMNEAEAKNELYNGNELIGTCQFSKEDELNMTDECVLNENVKEEMIESNTTNEQNFRAELDKINTDTNDNNKAKDVTNYNNKIIEENELDEMKVNLLTQIADNSDLCYNILTNENNPVTCLTGEKIEVYRSTRKKKKVPTATLR